MSVAVRAVFGEIERLARKTKFFFIALLPTLHGAKLLPSKLEANLKLCKTCFLFFISTSVFMLKRLFLHVHEN